MGGRTILFLVIGFSMIFLIKEKNFESTATDSAQNYYGYYSRTRAHNIAVSGANLVVNKFYLNPAQPSGNTNYNIDSGYATVNVALINPVLNTVLITSTGYFGDSTAVVKVILQNSYFSKFAYCSNNENGVWWATGDTVNGPFHTQDYLNVNGHPVFNPSANSSVSTLLGLNLANSGSSPIINGSYHQGDNLQIPASGISALDSAAASKGRLFTGMDSVYLNFQGNNITYTTFHDTTITSTYTYRGRQYTTTTTQHLPPVVATAPASTFSSNGVIFAENALVRVKGVVNGQFTIGSSSSSSSTLRGSIYIDSSIVYNTDPRVDPSSKDLLGLVAQNYVYVANNANNTNNVYIDAAIYSQNYGFGAENYSSRPYNGTIYLLGGITQNIRQAVGVIGYNGTISNGFTKNYNYDNRLLSYVPPSYPKTGSYTVVAWYE